MKITLWNILYIHFFNKMLLAYIFMYNQKRYMTIANYLFFYKSIKVML